MELFFLLDFRREEIDHLIILMTGVSFFQLKLYKRYKKRISQAFTELNGQILLLNYIFLPLTLFFLPVPIE